MTAARAPEPRKAAGAFTPVAITAVTILAGLFAAAAVNATPRDPARIAAVFPPWWSPAEVIAAAGSAGTISGAGGTGNILILRGDAADLASRARSAGAMLILDPDLAGLCAPRPTEQSS